MRSSGWRTLLFTLALVACGRYERRAESPARNGDFAGSPPANTAPQMALSPGLDAATAAPFASAEAKALEASGTLPRAEGDPSLGSTMIIRAGQASLLVDSLDIAIAKVRQLAAGAGGYIADSRMQAGNHQLRSATIEIKVPAMRFDELGDGLSRIGQVEYLNISTQDVGEEYTDVAARVANAHRLEGRLVELIATRTGKLSDVLEIEREVARVREEIERMEGRLRYLKAHAAMSSLTITVHEKVPIVGQPGSSGLIAGAFRRAWDNFLGLLSGFIASLGVVLPLSLLAIAAVGLLRSLWRRRSEPTSP